MAAEYTPISCDRHDFLEIACLYHYVITIETTDGQRVTGQAVTTRTHSDKSEWLEFNTDEISKQIRLDHIRAITPTPERAVFKRQLISHL
ncbi:Rho-binding antiterminator [Hahella ganghwensis]|uniref:Rho-binding antiterminator n=1 Tax=Hahella ganghwensis TaxID=286420 RepID=UPI000368EFDF|nr:Rho-binding antiterminator [Hahella ganghwensis]